MLSLRNSEGQIMERRKILIIGMFDSIHLARWLSQFTDEKINFLLFPSKKFRYIHPELNTLIQSNNVCTFSFAKPYFFQKYIGFIDYLLNTILRKIGINFKRILLIKVLEKNNFEYVHAIEMQGAGYLYASLPNQLVEKNKLIITNYGSDIFYYSNVADHKNKVSSVLTLAKYYSGECQRDYELALRMGFNGKLLPCIPNAGGFKREIFALNVIPSDNRNLLVAKCYGGEFGLGKLVIRALHDFLPNKNDIQVLLYSVTDDLLNEAIALQRKFSEQIQLFKIRDAIDRLDFLKYFASARIYLGASKSDGISTAFLEALCLGAYPIQTNTSCANDWLNIGFNGSIIEPTLSAILETLEMINKEIDLDVKRLSNLNLAQNYLSFDSIKSQALKFYEVNV